MFLDNNKQHKHKTYDARARMFIRSELAWLWGYPLKTGADTIRWQVLYFAEPWEAVELTIDGLKISTSQRTINRLVKDFPKALPRVVGDVDYWTQLQAVKLSAIKKVLAGNTVDPWLDIIAQLAPHRLLQQGQQLRADFPALTIVIDAFAWCLSGDLKALHKAMLWLEKNSSLLIAINHLLSNSLSNSLSHESTASSINAVRPILELFQLEQKVKTKYVQHFIESIANEDFIHFFSINGGAWGALKKPEIKSRKHVNADEVLTISPQQKQKTITQICDFIYTLNTQSVAHRRQSLMLFSTVVNNVFLLYLRDFFEEVDQIRPIVKKLLFGYCESEEKELLTKNYKRQRKLIKKKYLPAIEAKYFFSMIEWCVSDNKLVALLIKQAQLFKSLDNSLSQANKKTSNETSKKRPPWQHPMIMLYWINYLKSLALPDIASKTFFQGIFNQYLTDSSSVNHRLQRLHPWSKLLRKSSLNPYNKKFYYASILSYHASYFYIDEEHATRDSFRHYFQLLGKRSDDLYNAENSNKPITNKEARKLYKFMSYSLATSKADSKLGSNNNNLVYNYYQEAYKIRPSLKYLYHNEYKLLHQAAKGEAKLFGYFYKLWTVPVKLKDDSNIDDFIWDDDRENSITMLAKLAELGYLQSALYLSEQQDYGVLKNTASLLQIFIDLKIKVPQPSVQIKKGFVSDGFPDWLGHYPDALNTGLFALLKYHANPKKAADQVLSSDIPTTRHLQQQIDYLTKQDESSAQPRFKKRIKQLKKRVNRPVKVGSTRLKRLDKKLQHAAHIALIHNWHKQLEQALYQRINHSLQQLGLNNVDDFEPRYLKTLTALLPLKDKIKTQGYRILLSHAGYHHWDYYAEPANQQFIQNLEKKGIHTAPWLASRVQEFEKRTAEKGTTEKAKNERAKKERAKKERAKKERAKKEKGTPEKAKNEKIWRLRLQLEQDSLALFYMGTHFSSCLSHYDFNFFSVIANIIDINKQVIFAYDDNGKVQGRCLIALTDTGKILNYHYYNHYSGDVFQCMVDEYIDQLAAEMKTTRVSRGTPSKLIAYDWYDDIANDFRQLSSIMEEDDVLDQQLCEVDTDDLLPTLTQAIAPNKLGATALELLTYMDCFKERPELSLLLWEKVQRLPTSSHDTRFAFAISLINQDEDNAAFSLLGKWFVAYAINKLMYYDWEIEDTLKLLLAMSPSLTLRVLQQSRTSSIRNWQDETSAQRLFAAAQAFDLLKRPNMAIELYQLAMQNEWDGLKKEQKKFARKRVAHYQLSGGK